MQIRYSRLHYLEFPPEFIVIPLARVATSWPLLISLSIFPELFHARCENNADYSRRDEARIDQSP